MVSSIFRKPHPDLDAGNLVQATLKTPTDIGVAMLMLDIFGADRLTPPAKLKKPALVIASAESPLLDEEKQMAATIPSAKFVAIAGVGHAVFVDDPARFDAELRNFLAQLGEPTMVH